MIIQAETLQKQHVTVEATSVIQRFGAYGMLHKRDGILVIKTHADTWELPGGMPEKGETITEGLLRELNEEVGISATIGRMVFTRESFYHTPSGKTYHSVQFYFLIHTDDTPVATAETKECAFVRIKDLTHETTNTSTYAAIQSLGSGTPYQLWS